MHYEVEITRTSKPVRSRQEYQVFDHEIKRFLTEQDAKAFLKEEYFRYDKRMKAYADSEDGDPVHVGWIYCSRGNDGREEWMQQDRVEVREVSQGKPVRVTV